MSHLKVAVGFTDISVAILDEIALAPKDLLPTLAFCLRGQNITPQIYAMSTPRARYLV